MADLFHPVSGEGPETAAQSLGPWTGCARAPRVATHPDQLATATGEWLPAAVPGTVAETLRAAGRWDF